VTDVSLPARDMWQARTPQLYSTDDMTPAITEHVLKTARHTSFYLACGPEDGTPLLFLHGWPELSISWRHQLPVFGALGFRAIAPDMRGYGRSSVYRTHAAYALTESVTDMLELLDQLGAARAIWVGHDKGSPVVWSMAQHHPERCHGVASLCVPYLPNGFAAENLIALADRTLYPADSLPAAQWDYQLFYRDNFEAATAAFEVDVRSTVRALFRAGQAAGQGKQSRTAFASKNGGMLGANGAPKVARDERVLTQEDEHRYVEALERNGFFGPDSWYMNWQADTAFATRGSARLSMPVLFPMPATTTCARP
jgi:pimeloyl-ACP methyl ester carboxylesterase